MKNLKFLSIGVISLFLCSCDSRPSPGSEADGSPTLDSLGRPNQKNPTEVGAGNQCKTWKGFCSSTEDCPEGFTCEGCRGNPCCPECDVCAGTCTPIPIIPDACNSNKDCDIDPGGDSFCNLDQICLSWASEGSCQAKPIDCPDYDDCQEVCGCNGLPYCSECEAHAAGVSVAGTEACANPPMDCAQLNVLYQQTVQSAKGCCANCGDVEQCTVKVWDQLNTGCPCPCETYINDDPPAIATLDSLAQQWVNMGCGQSLEEGEPWSCCALYPACEPTVGGTCAPDNFCDNVY